MTGLFVSTGTRENSVKHRKVGRKSDEPCFRKKFMDARVMAFCDSLNMKYRYI